MYRKRRRRRRRLTKAERDKKLMYATAVLVICILVFAVCLISASNSVLEDVGDTEDIYMTEEEENDGTLENREGETGANESYQTALPENASYNDALSADVEYSFKLTNEELLTENGFSDEQVKVSQVLLEQYIQSNISGILLDDVKAVEDTVYSCNGYFSAIFCLNEEASEYAEVTGNGSDVKCTENIYSAPVKQYETDIADETEEHGQYDMLYDGTFSDEMDSEEFPYSEQEVEKLVTGYYSDLTEKNAYENYLYYFLPMTEYMQIEWTSFNSNFCTFQNSVSQLKELLADGNTELLEKGKLSASITGYRQYSYTVVTARVNVTLTDGSDENTRVEYVTIGYNNDGLFILPHDLYTMNYWRYMYLY